MSNLNDYAGEPTYSKHVCTLMRRINALQVAVPYIETDSFQVPSYLWAASHTNGSMYLFNNVGTLGTRRISRCGTDGSVSGSFDVYADESRMSLVDGSLYFHDTDDLKRYTLDGTFTNDINFPAITGGDGLEPNSDVDGNIVTTVNGNSFQRHTVDGTFIDEFYGPTISGTTCNEQYFTNDGTRNVALNLYNGVPAVARLQDFGSGTTYQSEIMNQSGLIPIGYRPYHAGNGTMAVTLEAGASYEINIINPAGTVQQTIPGAKIAMQSGGGELYVFPILSPSGSATVYRYTPGTAAANNWQGYARATRASIGTSPANNALVYAQATKFETVAKTLIQMRDAIETLAPHYELSGTRWTFANLYNDAMGDRTKYGATGGTRTTWTRSEANLLTDNRMYDIDIGEVEEIVTKLEASSIA